MHCATFLLPSEPATKGVVMPTRVPRQSHPERQQTRIGRPTQERVAPPHEKAFHWKKIDTPSPGTLGPFIDTFTEHFMTCHNSPCSAYYYKRELEILANHFPEKEPQDFSKKDLLDFTALRRDLSPRSRKRTISILRGFFRWCDDTEIIGRNPATILKSPPLPRSAPRYLSPTDIHALFDAMDGNILMQTYTALGCYAGLRRGSIHTLRWDDTDLTERTLTLLHTKGDKTNILPISRDLYRYLTLFRRITRESDCPLVIAHYYKGEWRPYSWSQAYRMLKTYCARAGLDEKVSAHDLRRTFATTLHQRGVDTTVISRLLGHSDISTTLNHYTFTNDEQKADAIDRLHY